MVSAVQCNLGVVMGWFRRRGVVHWGGEGGGVRRRGDVQYSKSAGVGVVLVAWWRVMEGGGEGEGNLGSDHVEADDDLELDAKREYLPLSVNALPHLHTDIPADYPSHNGEQEVCSDDDADEEGQRGPT